MSWNVDGVVLARVIAISAGMACLGVIRSRALRGGLRGMSRGLSSRAPKAKMKSKSVAYGFVEGEQRGGNPMKPPKILYDPYYWLRDDDRKDPEVISYLKEENEYFKDQTGHLQPAAKEIYDDFLSHVQETDSSVPYPYGPFEYYSRTIEGSSYHIYCRRSRGDESTEEIILDMNQVAKGKAHCDLGSLAVSPDHSLLCYLIDESGYETFTPFIKELSTGKILSNDGMPQMGEALWGADESSIFYTTLDSSHRPYKLWRHYLGTPASQDELLYTEENVEFWLSVGKSQSSRFIFCHLGSKNTSEIWFLDLQGGKDACLTCFEPREHNVRYSIDHHAQHFYIVTNIDGCKNQKLMRTVVTATSRKKWVEVIPYSPEIYIQHVTCFSSKIIIEGRKDGFSCIWVHQPGTNEMTMLEDFPETVATVDLGVNKEYNTKCIRVLYSSMVSPETTYDVELNTLKKTQIHVKNVPNYDKNDYVCRRLVAPAHDGKMIPLSIAYKKGSTFDVENGKLVPGPLFLNGYGSYGICMEPQFSSLYVSLLDRGLAVVHAHIRGGSEMGRSWYEDEGKFLSKKNTFYDFISCAKFLLKEGYTTKSQLAIHGRSAGGLLMGNVLNMAPELFKCAVCGVPFVDLCTTMSDSTIPLTNVEWEEWGNPNEAKYFDYMLSYDPYQNVTMQDYPAIMVLAGLYDPRVAYWEPAKWVARLRAHKTDSNVLLLKTDLESGHFSASDRYKYFKEKSIEFAFIVDQVVVQGQ